VEFQLIIILTLPTRATRLRSIRLLRLRRELWALDRRMAWLGADRTRLGRKHFGPFFKLGFQVNFIAEAEAKQAKQILKLKI
jgi:hypothetical protein